MATRKHYIGVDVGTGSARACVMSDSGDILGLASQEIRLWQPEAAHYEQSSRNIWAAVRSCVKQATAESTIDPATIKGIGFDATCSLAVFSNDTNEPISVTASHFDKPDSNDRNIILWLDHRPVEETKAINATQHALLQHVGGQMSIEMEVPKILWLKNNMPKDLFERCKFFDLADALTHMATGGETRSLLSEERRQNHVSVGVDGTVKGWSNDFLDDIGLSILHKDADKRVGGVDRNGHFRAAGELVGTLSKTAAADMGIPAGIAVGSGVIDAYAGWIGTVGAEIGENDGKTTNDLSRANTRLAAVAGTSTCHLVMSLDPHFVEGVWGPFPDVLIPGSFMSEGGQSATGELLKHVVETHPAHAEAVSAANSANINIYDHLNNTLKDMMTREKAPTISFLGRHFFFYGDFFGNRSPIADPAMAGAIIGLTADRSVRGLALSYYGAMEFIALQTRQIIETMNSNGHAISSIFMSGSLCQNDILMSLMATACDMPVVIPKYAQAAVVHGAAMLGAKAASADEDGNTEPLWDIMQRMSKAGKAVYPNADEREKRLLQAKYRVFLELCESQQRYRREVDAATEVSTVMT